MDTLESVLQDKDTTFVFMLESLARGHQIFHLGLRGLFTYGHQAFAWARRCEVMRATPHYRFLNAGAQYPLEAFDAIFMRKDPPADAAYLFATMLLSLADSRRTFVLNSPSGLREANEKLYALNFPGAIPPTIVTYEIARLKKFMAEQGGEMIVKPLDGHGGESVFLARAGDRNLNAILEAVTHFESRRRQAAYRARRRAARMHAQGAARRRASGQYARRRQRDQSGNHTARPRDLPHDAA